jgi:hypothetical protein
VTGGTPVEFRCAARQLFLDAIFLRRRPHSHPKADIVVNGGGAGSVAAKRILCEDAVRFWQRMT